MDQIYPERAFPVENRKGQQLHWVVQIWTGIVTKFQLKLAILIFWVTARLSHWWVKIQVSTNQNSINCWFQIVRRTICIKLQSFDIRKMALYLRMYKTFHPWFSLHFLVRFMEKKASYKVLWYFCLFSQTYEVAKFWMIKLT